MAEYFESVSDVLRKFLVKLESESNFRSDGFSPDKDLYDTKEYRLAYSLVQKFEAVTSPVIGADEAQRLSEEAKSAFKFASVADQQYQSKQHQTVDAMMDAFTEEYFLYPKLNQIVVEISALAIELRT